MAENYENLKAALEDICSEVNEMKSITINDKTYDIETYLGGDLKFLAMVCGIQMLLIASMLAFGANAQHQSNGI